MTGLSESQVLESRRKHGDNSISQKKQNGFFKKFIANLGDPVIKILLIALGLNIIFMFKNANFFETGGIAISVFLATLISTLSEHGSEEAFRRLSLECARVKCRVIREGKVCEIDIEEIVVGDLVLIASGEQVPADGYLSLGALSLDQSSMTGENREIKKRTRSRGDAEDTSPASPYFCLRGCVVLSGEGVMCVERVGDKTTMGEISMDIQEDTRESPLRVRLTRLAKQISMLGYIAAGLVAAVSLGYDFIFESAFDPSIILYKLTSFPYLFSKLFSALTLALTVIVVAVPEGLPMMIAVVLSSNIKKMVRDNVLIRKPVGIEAAGSMNILFTDKTGTLTEGVLKVDEIYSGLCDGYTSMSRFSSVGGEIYRKYVLSAYYNGSSVKGENSEGKTEALGGNTTEQAILRSVLSEKMPICNVLSRIGFDSEKKFSAIEYTQGRQVGVLIKGAPDKLLPYVGHCILPNGDRVRINRERTEGKIKELSGGGRRVLLLCEREGRSGGIINGEFGALSLICIIVLQDKMRCEARTSVDNLSGAGVQVVMLTGDGKETAARIARESGIVRGSDDIILDGGELRGMSDEVLKGILPHLRVLARALPSDKSRLVKLSQECGLVVGMTGDGVNDAPALKRADVGFAMGSGTEVAKEAGDIIILDNNLSSIVKSVLYGRNIFKSIRKFISLQLTMNLCAVGVSMICPFLGIESPVTVVQMLWINIIMDTLGGLAFAGEAALPSCMKEKPKRRDEPILNGYMINGIIWNGIFTIALCIAFLKIPEIASRFRWAPDNIYLLTAFFALFIFSSVFNCFNFRTDRLNIFSGLSKNPAFIAIMSIVLVIQIIFVYLGGAVLRTAPLVVSELLFVSLLALTVFPAEMIRKVIWRVFVGKKGY